MAPIQAIPTVYEGVRFRSRLEADWARAFDERGIAWAYEPQGFRLGGIYYLPDFWLPALRTVVEAKGILDAEDDRKIQSFARVANDCGVLVVLAEAPAGVRWRVATGDGAYEAFREGLSLCPACSAWQFMAYGCRRCSHSRRAETMAEAVARGLGDSLADRLRWWAYELAKLGRFRDAADVEAEAMRVEVAA